MTSLLAHLALVSPAHAIPGGLPECSDGETLKQVTRGVWVPSYVSNAERGDVVVTAGGTEIPQRMLSTLGQTYNHALLVSRPDNGAGHTTFTHDTAIAIGSEATFVGVIWAPTLTRTLPGNAIGDTADTLLGGSYLGCNNQFGMQYCYQNGARPVNLWRGSTLLVRPDPTVIGTQNLADIAEAHPAASLPYSVAAYTFYLDALNGTGVELLNGPGTMCSGFVADALNTALANAGSTVNVAPRLYTQPLRVAAANALFAKIREVAPAWTAHQVAACFAFGGPCLGSPLDQLALTAPGTGLSISPDDLLNSSTPTNRWRGTMTQATFGGGYGYDVFDHYECCSDETGVCRIPTVDPPVPLDPGYLGEELEDFGDDPPPGHTTATVRAIRERSAWVDFAASAPGTWDESDEELCWVSSVGRLCTSLAGLEILPEAVEWEPTDAMLDPENVRALEENPELAREERPPGTVHVVGSTADGAPQDDLDLIRDLVIEGGDTVCRGQAFVASVDLAPDAARADVQIDGIPGEAVAVRFDIATPSTLTAVVRVGDVQQAFSRTVDVVDCGPQAKLESTWSTGEDSTVSFDLELPEPPVKGTRFLWSFGDGSTAETKAPTVEHSYRLRPQRSERSGFLVSVTTEGSETPVVTSVTFANPARSVLQRTGTTELPVEHARKPGWGPNGLELSMQVRTLDTAARLESVRLRGIPCDPTLEPSSYGYSYAEVASGPVEVEADRVATLDLTLPVAWTEHAICRWHTTITGRTNGRALTATALFETGALDGSDSTLDRAKARQALIDLVTRAGGGPVRDVAAASTDLADVANLTFVDTFGTVGPKLPTAATVQALLEPAVDALVEGGCLLESHVETSLSGAYGPGFFAGEDDDGALSNGLVDPKARVLGGELSSGTAFGAPDLYSVLNVQGQLYAEREDGGFVVGRWKRVRGTRGTFYAVSGTCPGDGNARDALRSWFPGIE